LQQILREARGRANAAFSRLKHGEFTVNSRTARGAGHDVTAY